MKIKTLIRNNICPPVFIAALPTIAKIKKNLYPSIDERIKRKSYHLEQHGWTLRSYVFCIFYKPYNLASITLKNKHRHS